MKTVDCSHRPRAGPARAPDADRLPGAERSTCTRAQRPAQRTSALPYLNSMPPTSPAILWMAPAFSGGGYSSEALAFAQGLMPLLGKRFKLRQFAEQADESFFHGLPESLTKPLLLRFDFPNADPGKGTVVCHSPPDAWRPSKFPGWDQLAPCPPPNAKFVIGRTMYETDSVPRDWVDRCNQMDSVWVPTDFHRVSFRKAGVAAHKLVVVGEPVDSAFFDPAKATPFLLPPVRPPKPTAGAPPPSSSTTGAATPPFRFLAVFKWERRKGWDALLEAYYSEFGAEEEVELVLKTRAFHSSDDFDGLISDFVQRRQLPTKPWRRAAVRVLDEDLTLGQLRDLYRAADCFVLPSRGEGWGRPHVEAMAMGLCALRATRARAPNSPLPAPRPHRRSGPTRLASLSRNRKGLCTWAPPLPLTGAHGS